MTRVTYGVILFVLAGCQSPERAAIQPLPENQAITYPDLVLRARSQVSAAQEFFYQDRWPEVEQAADALQQTAKLLGKLDPPEVPAKQRDHLSKHLEVLSQGAKDLHDAARARDVNKTSDAFRTLNLKVRDLRPE
jgi:hypothetical protein